MPRSVTTVWSYLYLIFKIKLEMLNGCQELGRRKGGCDYKWAAQESSFVVVGQFCILIVLVAFKSMYGIKCHRIIHKDKNQMYAKTGEIQVKYIVQLLVPINFLGLIMHCSLQDVTIGGSWVIGTQNFLVLVLQFIVNL